jgi:hypothetical protein
MELLHAVRLLNGYRLNYLRLETSINYCKPIVLQLATCGFRAVAHLPTVVLVGLVDTRRWCYALIVEVRLTRRSVARQSARKQSDHD